jgi:four helix bundle protein
MTSRFPTEEKYCLVSQIRRAALSVHLNVAEGSARSSLNERKRFYEIARSSVVEVDTAIGVAVYLKYINAETLQLIEELLNRSFQLLSRMVN